MFSSIKKLHFVGIGGIGMSGIAEILIDQGFTVTGSDRAASENTERLGALGALILTGYLQYRDKMTWVGNWNLWDALQWSDIDLEAGTVTIQRSLSWARLPGEEVRPRFFKPKTKAGVRKIPLAPELAQKAVGILIFPKVMKVGFWLGGGAGEGALQVGGETVQYYRTTSLSYGLMP